MESLTRPVVRKNSVNTFYVHAKLIPSKMSLGFILWELGPSAVDSNPYGACYRLRGLMDADQLPELLRRRVRKHTFRL